MPTTAVTNNSLLGSIATSISPSMPVTTFTGKSDIASFNSSALPFSHTQTIDGINSLICCSNKEILEPAARAVTLISPFALTTSSVCVPMEPVEPRIAIFFFLSAIIAPI